MLYALSDGDNWDVFPAVGKKLMKKIFCWGFFRLGTRSTGGTGVRYARVGRVAYDDGTWYVCRRGTANLAGRWAEKLTDWLNRGKGRLS